MMPRVRQAGLSAMVLVCGLFVASCSSSPPPAQLPPAGPGVAGLGPGATPANAPAGAADTVEGYTLGPGDQIRLTVFRHPDLSGEFQLDGTGDFAMPLVGDIAARNLTARALEDRVEARLKEEGYLIDPQVSIEVLNYRPFYIIGEVNRPGSYAYVNGMTVVNAVALAGGFTYRADQDDIMIKRGGSGARPMEVTQATEVLPGDIIEVPERWF